MVCGSQQSFRVLSPRWTAYCGDGFCNSTRGENCVNCAPDCHAAFCGVCGDGQCDNSTENCTSCLADCGACASICPPCSKHGRCVADVCVCDDTWSGPTCDITTQPIVVIINTTSPIVDVLPSKNNSFVESHISFKIGARRLTERSQQGTEVDVIDLDTVNFTLSRPPFFSASPTKNEVWMYSAVLRNLAIVNVTFIQFNDAVTNYTFHNQILKFPANTLKLNIRIENWPFKSIQNVLEVDLENSITEKEGQKSKCSTATNHKSDESESLLWLKITLNGVAIYAQFVSEAYIDERRRSDTKFTLAGNSSVIAVLPHFWNSADMDPNYSVLIDPYGGCVDAVKKSSSSTRTAVIASVVVIVGLSLVLATAYVMVREYKKKKALARLRSISMHSYSSGSSVTGKEEKEVIIEKASPMEVNTATGKFRVDM